MIYIPFTYGEFNADNDTRPAESFSLSAKAPWEEGWLQVGAKIPKHFHRSALCIF